MTSTVSKRIKRHTKVSGPERLVDTGEVEVHLGEMLYGVVGWLKSKISHLTQPEVHSFCSPLSIFTEETPVSINQCIECSSVGRNITIIYQILHHLLCHVHSSHLSSPTINQQGVCHDIRTHSFVSLHLLEQVHCTIHVLQLDPTLHECGVSTNIRSQSCSSHRFKK